MYLIKAFVFPIGNTHFSLFSRGCMTCKFKPSFKHPPVVVLQHCCFLVECSFFFPGVQCHPLHQCNHRCKSTALFVACVCGIPYRPTYYHCINVPYLLPFPAVITISRPRSPRQQRLSSPKRRILAQPSRDRCTLWCYLHL